MKDSFWISVNQFCAVQSLIARLTQYQNISYDADFDHVKSPGNVS